MPLGVRVEGFALAAGFAAGLAGHQLDDVRGHAGQALADGFLHGRLLGSLREEEGGGAIGPRPRHVAKHVGEGEVRVDADFLHPSARLARLGIVVNHQGGFGEVHEHPLAQQGEPWAIDPGYDIDPHDVQFGGTRFLKLRQIPVIEVLRVEMVYPGQPTPVFTVPAEWLRLDQRFGHLQILPIGGQFGYSIQGAGLAMAVITGGAVLPQVFHVHYRAGMENIAQNYPDLIDIALRLAVVGILKSRALPQSGSISGDGLSQSFSAPDLGALQDQIDDDLEIVRNSIVGMRFTVL